MSCCARACFQVRFIPRDVSSTLTDSVKIVWLLGSLILSSCSCFQSILYIEKREVEKIGVPGDEASYIL